MKLKRTQRKGANKWEGNEGRLIAMILL
jgi:hypothetical protein